MIDEVKYGRKAVADVAEVKKAKVISVAKSFIVVIQELGIQEAKNDAIITRIGVDFCIKQKELGR